MSFREWLEDAKVELDDLRRVPGKTLPTDSERARYGQQAALAYLASGDIVMLEAAGATKLGALLATLGPEYLAISSVGCALLGNASRVLGDDGEETPEVAWDVLRPTIQAHGPASDFLSACEQCYPALGLRVLAIAANLIQGDTLRRHLAGAQRITAPGIGPVVAAPVPASAPSAPADPHQRALAIREAEAKALVPAIPLAEAAKTLLVLAPPQRALAIAAAFTNLMDSAPPEEADDAGERFGRRIEGVLDEMPEGEGTATLAAMIQSGDVEAVLSAVRGRAGEVSSTAERLTRALISELFERDPDMHNSDRREGRLVTLCHTLICETREDHPVINGFFNSPEGQALLRALLQSSRGGDEDALEILRTAERRGIVVPATVEARDEDEDDQRRDPDAEEGGEDFEPPPDPDEEDQGDANDHE